MRKKSLWLGVWCIVGMCVSCAEEVKILDTEPVAAGVTDTLTLVTDLLPEVDTLPVLPCKCIYLTIDDSPLNGTKYLDSVIVAETIKANVFMVGKAIDESRKFQNYHKILQENPYIEIYNHSYSHASNRYFHFYGDPASVLDDFEMNRSKFHIEHKIARLPGRNLWLLGDRKRNCDQPAGRAAALLADEGYQIFGWDLEWRYAAEDYVPEQTIDQLVVQAEYLYTSSRTFTPDHVVLLIHDQMFARRHEQNDLGELIRKLKEKDFTFEYLTAYPVSMDERQE